MRLWENKEVNINCHFKFDFFVDRAKNRVAREVVKTIDDSDCLQERRSEKRELKNLFGQKIRSEKRETAQLNCQKRWKCSWILCRQFTSQPYISANTFLELPFGFSFFCLFFCRRLSSWNPHWIFQAVSLAWPMKNLPFSFRRMSRISSRIIRRQQVIPGKFTSVCVCVPFSRSRLFCLQRRRWDFEVYCHDTEQWPRDVNRAIEKIVSQATVCDLFLESLIRKSLPLTHDVHTIMIVCACIGMGQGHSSTFEIYFYIPRVLYLHACFTIIR